MDAVYADAATAPVSDRVRAALALIARMTRSPEELRPDDIASARAAGLTDDDIRSAAGICAAFNTIDRLADALAFRVPDQAGFDRAARVLLRVGYRIPPPIRWFS